jgi:hypothetical protein
MIGKEMKLPRGRVPSDAMKLKTYIQNVAVLNGVSYAAAEKFVNKRSPTAQQAIAQNPDLHETAPVEPEIPETDAEILSRVGERFNMLNTITRGCCTGAVRSTIVSGVGGVGKTHAIEQILDHYRETQNIQSEVVRGVLSAVNLYKLLYRNRTKHCITVLDDADGIFWDEDALSILKVALDSSLTRKISWMSESQALKNDDVPNTFEYAGSMIFITNIDFQTYVDNGKGKLAPHLQALLTRTMYLDLKLHTDRDLMLWIDHVITKNHVLVKDGLKHEQEKEVLDFMKANRTDLRNLSIRTALKLAMLVKMNPAKWQTMARTVECK